MKIFKFLAVAFVAMLGFTACDKDCDHDFIEHDFTQDIVGTWTTLNGELAEAMVIKADGSFTTTGVMKGGSLYEEKGTIKVVNNKVTLAFDGDKETFEGRLEFVAGKSLSLVMFDDNDVRLTYDYCANDLSDEILGMWVCTQIQSGMPADMFIQTFKDNGKSIYTGYETITDSMLLNKESSYKVIGDLCFLQTGNENKVMRLTYSPKGTTLGDIMIFNNTDIKNATWLRIKQSLNLTGTYDYSSAYVSNAKGKDEDFTIFDHTFNFANISANKLDVFYRSELFCLDLNANSIKHYFHPYDRDVEVETPITVDGNKVTLDFSAIVPALRKVEMYMFQDADDSQLHIYMPTQSFINYFANLEIVTMLQGGKLDPTDATVVDKVFADMEVRVESINVSFVLKARK